MLRKTRVGAFTLMECLVALLVISSSLLLFDGLSRYLVTDMRHQAKHVQKDWLIFSEELRQELDQSQLIKVEDNKLYVKKAGQALAFGKSKSDDFRKTDWSGKGYQPMIQGLEQATVQQDGAVLRINFRFETGLERTFIYVVEETN